MSQYNIDILAFGAHADDVEIGMGGTIAKYAMHGKRIVICDLTHAELSSNGDVTTRKKEATKAAEILGVEQREFLSIPDRGLLLTEEHIQMAVKIIRKYRPEIIFAPYEIDRHPDHGNASRIVQEAFFSSGIKKYYPESLGDAHKPKQLYFYMINGFHQPNFIIDIGETMEKKLDSLRAYKSQFVQQPNGVQTPLTEGYIESVEARERMMGKEIGISYGEGFLTKKPILLHHDLIGECL